MEKILAQEIIKLLSKESMMNIDGKLSKSIRESLQILNSGVVKLYNPEGCSVNPIFRGNREKITCPQVDYFGFYALRNAFRGIFLSVNYFSAGQYALLEKLYGPSVALFILPRIMRYYLFLRSMDEY